jgi:hypothetical protein
MPISEFEEKPGEKILFRNTPNRKWFVITWKIVSGCVGITILIFVLYSLLASKTEGALTSFLPTWIASLITNFIFLGLVPLAAVSWVIEDIASVFIGEFILTNQRIWIRGSPYAWSRCQILVDDILSLSWRRDAIFIRQKSTRKLHVHMFSYGKDFVQTFQRYVGKSNES